MELIEKIFKLKKNNTSIKTELIAGLTTFFTMAYLLIISPKILEITGLNITSTVSVTAITVFIGSLLMAFIANKPYAVAPFLGETAFIAYIIVSLQGFSVETALASIFICGLILLFMTIINLRTFIINQIPENIKISFCAGLGLFFIFIALKDIGIVQFTSKNIPLQAGNFLSLHIILGLICFLSIIILSAKKIKAAVIISIVLTTILGILFHDIKLPSEIVSLPGDISSSLFRTDFSNIFNIKFLPVFFIIFILVNIDTSGAIIALDYRSEEKGNDCKKTMIADSLSVIAAPLMGTTTPGAYIDSMTGISAGGRTGLTALTVGFLFLLGLFFTPLILIIPPYAYAPALLYVGILMTSVITKIDFNDISEYAPAVLTISVMIFTYNIGLGIISAFIIYPLIKLFCGQKNETNITTWIMFVISFIFFMIYPY